MNIILVFILNIIPKGFKHILLILFLSFPIINFFYLNNLFNYLLYYILYYF